MSLETSLWAWLAKARRHFGDALHIQRIENCVMSGTPDVEGYLRLPECAGQFWLELKATERPARRSTPIRFKLTDREEQIEFMNLRWMLGANAFWLLQVGSGSERTLFLAPGYLGVRLRHGMTEALLASECCNSGFFPRTVSPQDILKRVITCRKFPSLMAH